MCASVVCVVGRAASAACIDGSTCDGLQGSGSALLKVLMFSVMNKKTHVIMTGSRFMMVINRIRP